MDWMNVINERDADGNLTPLALAIDALADNGCDCGTDEPGTCLGCLCEQALHSQWERIAALEAEVARLTAPRTVSGPEAEVLAECGRDILACARLVLAARVEAEESELKRRDG